MTVSTLPRPEESLTDVGKPAPPMPVMPASRMTAMRSSALMAARASGSRGLTVGQSVSRPSDSMTMAVCRFPPGWGRASMAVTVPDTEAWTGTQRPWPSPIFWPTVTRSPTLTSGWQGAPMCCDIATETTLGCSGTMAASRESSL